MAAPTSPTGVVAVADDGVELLKEFVTLLENPTTTSEQITSIGTQLLSALGIIVSVFDHPLGLEISSVPQATIGAVSSLVLLGINLARAVSKLKTKQLATEMTSKRLIQRAGPQSALAR